MPNVISPLELARGLKNTNASGKTNIDARDEHIAGSGKAGVWTKADSVTLFDDFSYSALLNK